MRLVGYKIYLKIAESILLNLLRSCPNFQGFKTIMMKADSQYKANGSRNDICIKVHLLLKYHKEMNTYLYL